MTRLDLGIRTEDVTTFRLTPVLNGYEGAQMQALYERVEGELAAQPGVTDVSAASVAVFAGNSWGNNVMVEGFEAGPDTNRNSRFNRVGPGYYRTLGIPVLAGREFTESDDRESPQVVIVNEAFARKFNLGRDPVGKRMGRGGLDAELDMEIVGLVKDAKYNDVKNAEPPLFAVPYRQEGVRREPHLLRAHHAAARHPASIDPHPDGSAGPRSAGQRPQDATAAGARERVSRPADHHSVGSLRPARDAAGGGRLYGVLAYTVAQRTREIGLRMALGADPARLRAMVLGQVGRMTLLGGAVGLVAALGLERFARSLLFEIDGTPPGIIVAALLMLGVVALSAGFIPAHRASRINPMTALRYK